GGGPAPGGWRNPVALRHGGRSHPALPGLCLLGPLALWDCPALGQGLLPPAPPATRPAPRLAPRCRIGLRNRLGLRVLDLLLGLFLDPDAILRDRPVFDCRRGHGLSPGRRASRLFRLALERDRSLPRLVGD